jgi:hypothetical protein
MRPLIRVGLLLSVGLPALCLGQAPADSTGLTGVVNQVGAGTLSQPVSADSGVQVSAGQGNGSATIKMSEDFSSGGANSGVGYFNIGSLTASTPLSKSTSTTDLATLDGLANATTLELKYSGLRSSGLRIPNSAVTDPICAHAATAFSAANPTVKEIPDCDEGFVDKYDPAEFSAYQSQFWDVQVRSRLIWGVSAKAGYQNMSYTDTTTLGAKTVNETPLSGEAFLAYNPNAGHSLVTLDYTYQRAYTAATSKTVCPPNTSGGNITCGSGPFGAPKETDEELISVEVRHAFRGLLGVAVTATYDAQSHTKGIDLPLYFLKGSVASLTGGLDIGWRSDNPHATVGLFVASTGFGLFHGMTAGGKSSTPPTGGATSP